MEIELKKITIRELVKDYVDDPERGVSGYGGRLDIRPEYQREFVYKEKDRDARVPAQRHVLGEEEGWHVRGDGRAAAHDLDLPVCGG